eukprot:TRINITY_DN96393_c0_g1_i1.p1 TRINITY_DN96393_c0_g1~~TRINITY_DN96393_c0_g1_i1.p1  ORF type:complete len:137 (-),score=5.85 TRINITY_DN96393_c0_g1_i1:91-501(-)
MGNADSINVYGRDDNFRSANKWMLSTELPKNLRGHIKPCLYAQLVLDINAVITSHKNQPGSKSKTDWARALTTDLDRHFIDTGRMRNICPAGWEAEPFYSKSTLSALGRHRIGFVVRKQATQFEQDSVLSRKGTWC